MLKHLCLGIGIMMSIVRFSVADQGLELHFAPTDRILILAPHPDDEVLCCGGVIQQAIADHIPIQIVFLTYGDFDKWAFSLYQHSPVFRPKTMRAMGEVRRQEALAAARVLGLPADALIFLGYPDYGTLTIWNQHWAQSPAYESHNTRVSAVPYETAFRPHAPYKGDEILHDLGAILKTFQPTKVFVSDPADNNVDHRALYFFLRAALLPLAGNQAPALYTYLVHVPKWPVPRGLHTDQSINPPSSFKGQNQWVNFHLSVPQAKLKYAALEEHRTQTAYSNRFLTSFVRSNELFNTDVETGNATSDNGDLVLSGSCESTQCQVAAYGYRRDIPFEKMPKIQVVFKHAHVMVYDQQQPVLDSGVSAIRDERRFIVRIPLKLLNQPDTVFTSCGPARSPKPFGWDSLQIVVAVRSKP